MSVGILPALLSTVVLKLRRRALSLRSGLVLLSRMRGWVVIFLLLICLTRYQKCRARLFGCALELGMFLVALDTRQA